MKTYEIFGVVYEIHPYEREDLDEMLSKLAAAPTHEIDPKVVQGLKDLVGKPFEDVDLGLKRLLDISAHAALASDFAMVVMDFVWECVKVTHGKKLTYPDPETYTW